MKKLILMILIFHLHNGTLCAQVEEVAQDQVIELAFYAQKPSYSREAQKMQRLYGRKNVTCFEVTTEGKNKDRYYVELNLWPTIGKKFDYQYDDSVQAHHLYQQPVFHGNFEVDHREKMDFPEYQYIGAFWLNDPEIVASNYPVFFTLQDPEGAYQPDILVWFENKEELEQFDEKNTTLLEKSDIFTINQLIGKKTTNDGGSSFPTSFVSKKIKTNGFQ